MTEDITSLQIRILYDQVEKAEARLKKLETTGKGATKTVEGFGSKISSGLKGLYAFAAGATAVAGAITAFRSAIDTTREFQKLKASLQTVVGDLQTTELVWASMLDFAKTTPFELSESIKAFQQMVATGLIPTKESMTAFGDTAAALGYKLADMTEAVSKATVGEFEPLRKFFITARKEGDDVTFHFKGVATKVKNTAEEIQKYFTQLGQNNFAGAMEKQMLTLEGRFSNVEDAWKTFQYDLMTSTGAAEAFGGMLGMIAEKIAEVSDYVNSGALALDFESWTIGLNGYIEDVESGFNYLNELFVEHGEKGEETGMTLAEGLIGGIKAVISGYRAYVKTAATILWGLVDSAVQVAKAIYQTIAASFNALIGAALNAGAAIGNALNPFSNKSASQGFKEAGAKAFAGIASAADDTRKAWDQSLAKIGINGNTVAFNIKDAWKDARTEINDSATASLEADMKLEEYKKGADQRAKDRATKLEEYYKKLKEERDKRGNPNATPKKGGGGGGDRLSDFEKLEQDLRDEENLIAESYERRFALIEANTRDGSAYQAELEISLTEKFEEEQMKRIAALENSGVSMLEIYAMEEAAIEETYARRKEIILAATELTEKERLAMLEESERKYTSANLEALQNKWDATEKIFGDGLQNLQDVSKAFGKKGFAAYKAFAIAEATISGIKATIDAYAGGLKWSGNPIVATAFAATAAAATGAQIAGIAKQEYSGAYAIGGAIPAGKFGLVGEAGPELVKGPAMVTSAQSTWDRMGGAQAGGGGNNVEVKIINMSGEPVQEKRTKNGDKEMIEFIIGKAREAVANDISKGGTKVSRAMEGTYNMTRGKRA